MSLISSFPLYISVSASLFLSVSQLIRISHSLSSVSCICLFLSVSVYPLIFSLCSFLPPSSLFLSLFLSSPFVSLLFCLRTSHTNPYLLTCAGDTASYFLTRIFFTFPIPTHVNHFFFQHAMDTGNEKRTATGTIVALRHPRTSEQPLFFLDWYYCDCFTLLHFLLLSSLLMSLIFHLSDLSALSSLPHLSFSIPLIFLNSLNSVISVISVISLLSLLSLLPLLSLLSPLSLFWHI